MHTHHLFLFLEPQQAAFDQAADGAGEGPLKSWLDIGVWLPSAARPHRISMRSPGVPNVVVKAAPSVSQGAAHPSDRGGALGSCDDNGCRWRSGTAGSGARRSDGHSHNRPTASDRFRDPQRPLNLVAGTALHAPYLPFGISVEIDSVGLECRPSETPPLVRSLTRGRRGETSSL